MIFNCNKTNFITALNVVQKAIASKSTNPLLEGVNLKVENENVILVGTNVDLTIKTQFKCDAIEEGEIVVDAKLLTEIIKKLPDEFIQIKVINDSMIDIISGKSNFELVYMDPKQYPKLNNIDEDINLTLSGDILKSMIRGTVFAASVDEARPILNGILFEVKDEKLNIVASDGFRMAFKSCYLGMQNNFNIVVPSKTLNDVYRIVDDGMVKIGINKNHIIIKQNENLIVSRLIEGEFIKYESIFPRECNLSLEVDRAMLINAIERAALVIKEGNAKLIKFKISNDIITISSNSVMGKVTEDIVVNSQGDELTIAFNSKYIVDALKYTEEETVLMEFTSAFTPCLIKSIDNKDSIHLVLPVRLVEE